MSYIILILSVLRDFFNDFYLSLKEDNCSWCTHEVGRDNLTRIWYTETADDVCDACLKYE